MPAPPPPPPMLSQMSPTVSQAQNAAAAAAGSQGFDQTVKSGALGPAAPAAAKATLGGS